MLVRCIWVTRLSLEVLFRHGASKSVFMWYLCNEKHDNEQDLGRLRMQTYPILNKWLL